MQLESCKYDDLGKYSKVFNVNEIEYHLWIYLNPEDTRDAVFLKAYECGPNHWEDPTLPLGIFERESVCWIRAVTASLNMEPGKHTYKIMMVDRYTDTDFSLYVSYYIQDDNVDKPYVYMKSSDETNYDEDEVETFADA